MSTIKTIDAPHVELVALCMDCKIRHHSRVLTGTDFMREIDEWQCKHRGHRIEFNTPKRDIPRDLDDSLFEKESKAPWWLDYKENANIKLSYVSSAAMTYTSLNSLASDTNLLAGASALAVVNTSNLYLDYLLGGFITNIHTPAPTVSKEIDVYLYRSIDDSPTYPDTLLGTDATKTITTANLINSMLKQVASMTIAATVDQKNWFDAGAISSYFGGITPQLWSVFTVHNSAQALNSAGGTVSYSGAFATSI